MSSLLLSLAILAILTAYTTGSARKPSFEERSELQSKKHSHHFMGHEELMEGLFFLSQGKRRVSAVYPKLLEPTTNPTTPSPASSTSPSTYSTRSFPIGNRQVMVDDVIGVVENQSPQTQHHTISLSVFLLDTSVLMDESSRNIFERTALQFIVDRVDRIDLDIQTIRDISVVNQRLTWARLVDGKSSTGIEVFFEANAETSGDVKQDELEKEVQALFDLKARAFRKTLNFALYGDPTNDMPELSTEFLSLEPEIRVPLGLAAAAAGCTSFIAILVLSVCYVGNKDKSDETKDLSKSAFSEEHPEETPEEDPEVLVEGRLNLPVQEATGQQNFAIAPSEADELTFDDNSFSASLVFCPSVEKERAKELNLGQYFDCDHSAIESDLGTELTYSPVRQSKNTSECAVKPWRQDCRGARLTSDDLSNFDNEVRQAEC